MKNELMTFLSQFHSLTNEEIEIIARLLTVRELNKGTILVKEGQVCNECYFVLKGCLRQYMIIDGIEKTTQFYTENQTAVFFTS